ncbi:hypothetical protein NP590_04275 [Methylomonas sp. SURF-2]|uniref:Pilus assembly protein PilP n=1 Tax=Methylomonas subterranea TaxID=2952225 RepID=A0ABT1TDD8_9GAMM|nr:hypothetical protein [Methylomonas sp. SURF-2]MCQ8103314.1 hypothetical protein [Methylomonas sp. SURF-2]
MNMYAIIGLLWLSALAVARAEPEPALPQALALSPLRDPFSPSTLMYDSASAGNNAGNYGFFPSQAGGKIPEMKLRGLLSQNGEFLALLEIKGFGTFMVREGDEFTVDPAQPKNAIRIDKITRLSVTVETGMLGSIRVLR